MKFKTEVQIPESKSKIEIEDKIFSIGSCFATEMHDLLSRGQLQSLNNPFGTIFNPFSLNNAVKRLHDSNFYKEDELISYDNKFISLDHHSSFDADYAHKTVEAINRNVEAGNLFLQDTKWVIITYGTSFIYEFLPKQKLVANCHKIPGKFFNKRYLTHLELTDSVYETVQNLKDICHDDVKILFTVSPVRHTKDGFSENSLSKAKLLNAVHEIIEDFDFCHYLPVYEIMMDDLRDYRFYKDDMIHPSTLAVNYIFEKFGNAYFSEETVDFIEENFKIGQALNHRPTTENSAAYQNFISKLNEKMAVQQKKAKHKIFENHI